MKLPIDWHDLVHAYQGIMPTDPELVPLLRLDTGQVTCRAMMGDDDDAPDVLQVPVKGALKSFEQREAFCESLCEPNLRAALREALSGPDRFRAFDEVLKTVPIEATRWLEEEWIADVQHLCAWLRRADVEPDPEPTTSRKIIEFPLRRENT